MEPPQKRLTISALVPVRGAAGTLRAALSSLQAQTRRIDEIIVIDDGSEDGSLELAREIARADPRMLVLAQPPLGLVAALERGRAQVTGDWILRMDADDLSHRRRLSAQLAVLEMNPGVDVVGCAVRIFPRRELAEGFRLYEAWVNSLVEHEQIARERFVESPIVHPTVLARSEAIEAAGGWREVPWAEDYDLWMRMLELGRRFAKAAEPLLFWRDGPSRLTRVDARYSRARFLEAKAHFLARGPLAGRPTVVIWGAGRIGGQLARHLEDSHGVPVTAFLDIDPSRIGSTRRGRPVLAPGDLDLYPDCTVLAAVGVRGARELIRAHLDERGKTEGLDYWVVA